MRRITGGQSQYMKPESRRKYKVEGNNLKRNNILGDVKTLFGKDIGGHIGGKRLKIVVVRH